MIVTVANHKGGVGKTAVAAHLVFRAAESGRVLAIDLDAQGNLTSTLVARSEADRACLAPSICWSPLPLPVSCRSMAR